MNINRDEWVISHLKRLKGDLLDVGAGEKPFKKYCDHLNYYSHDFCQYDGVGNGIGLQFDWVYDDIDFISDITSLEVDDGTFDIILCTDVLEHVPDAVCALNEMCRVLKKGGTLIITTPYASLSHMAPQHFYPGFTRYFYIEHLDRNGCIIVDISINGNYYDYIAQECALKLRPEFSNYKLTERDKITINRMEQLLHRMGHSLKNEVSPLSLGVYIKAEKL